MLNTDSGHAIDVLERPVEQFSADQQPLARHEPEVVAQNAPPMPSTSAIRQFIAEMPPEIQRSFSSEQLGELSKALTRRYYQGPFVNYHKSGLGFFLTVYAGREKRSHRRLQIDKLKHHNRGLGNAVFLGGCLLAVASIAHLIYTLAT